MFEGGTKNRRRLNDDSLETFVKEVDQGVNSVVEPCRRQTVSLTESASGVLYPPSLDVINDRNSGSIGIISLYSAEYITMETFPFEVMFNP